MRYYVTSTLTNDHQYTNWTRPAERTMRPELIPTPVLIKGGANRAPAIEKKEGFETPKGVQTEVTETQMAYLEANSTFKKHLKKGFLVVTMEKDDANSIAKGSMTAKDRSAPLTPQDPLFQGDEAVKPVTTKETVVGAVINRVRGALAKNGEDNQ